MPYQYRQPLEITAFDQPPLVVDSTALVTNFNADFLDGQHGSFYQNADNLNAGYVPLARLGTNTPSAGQFLAHDNTWKTPAAGGLSGVKKDLRTEWNDNNDTDNDAFITIPHSLATTNLLVQIWYGDGAKLKQEGWGTNSNLPGYNGTQIIDANTVQVDALAVGNIELWAVGFAEIWLIPITAI